MSPRYSDSDALTELQALVNLIQDSFVSLKAGVALKALEFPSAYTPVTAESEAARVLPDVEQACSHIISAASQLIFAVRSPYQSVLAVAMQHQVSACLGVATAANIAEACREAGPQGAHVRDLARASNIDASKLSRVLRVLATNHIFIEVSPNVFANNRASSTLDTGKSVKELVENPGAKHVGTLGICAAVGHCTDEAIKSAAYLQNALLDPKIAASDEPTETPMNLAFNTKKPVWEWFEEEGNEHRVFRFGFAMEGVKHAAPQSSIVDGFDWKALKSNAVVVDVGGGIGSQSLTLAQTFDHLRFIIQDREPVLKDAVAFWNDNLPGARKAGRVTFQAHDFFTTQSVKNASVFLLRNILHDWSDRYCVQILRQLREAAVQDTRLMIVDNLMSFACVNEELHDIPGAQPVSAPSPLLPNGGHSNAIAYYMDIQMIGMMNSKERTVVEVRELMRQAGWKLVEVHQSSASAFSTQKAIAVPA